jgi:hypothetical protein
LLDRAIDSSHRGGKDIAVHFVTWPNLSKRREASVVLLAALVFLIGPPSPALAQSGTSGLVAANGFDEGTGTTVKDLSGKNLTGTIVGATWTTTGMYGNALSFNGTSSYVDLGNSSALQLTGSMTIEAWVKAAANPAMTAKSSPNRMVLAGN